MLEVTGQLCRYGPGTRMAAHADGVRRLSVLVSGAQEEHAGARSSGWTSCGSVVLKDPDLVHRNQFGDGGTTLVSVLLPDAVVQALGCAPDTLQAWRWHLAGPPSLAGLRLAAGLRQRVGPVVEECLIDLLGWFSPPDPAHPPEAPARLRRIRDRLHDEPNTVPSIRQLAAAEGIHPVSLGRAFRRAFGCSITRYRQRVRAAAVARALLADRTALTAIAYDHGFADSSHMTRLFRREIGVPPRHFRTDLASPPGARLESFKTAWTVAV